MNRRNKAKANSGPTTKLAQTAKQATPPAKTPQPATTIPPPTVKATPPPPPLTQPKDKTQPPLKVIPASAKLRVAWQSFEIWLSARRAERDKKLSEKLNELMTSANKNKGRFQRQPAPTPNLSSFEAELNQQLAAQARTEWVRRLAEAGLNEEDWADITPEEMAAVEAAFVPPEPVPDFLGNDLGHNSGPATFHEEPQWVPQAPGGWNNSPPLASHMPPKVNNNNRNGTQMNGRSLRQEPTAATESLWGMQMAKNAMSNHTPSPPIPAPGPTESLWETHMSKQRATPVNTTPVSKTTSLTEGESLWGMQMKRSASSQPKAPEPPTESLWEQQMSGRRPSPNYTPPSASQSTGLPTSESLWDMHMSKKPSPQPKASTLDPAPASLESLWDMQMKKTNSAKSAASFTQPPEEESLWAKHMVKEATPRPDHPRNPAPKPPAAATASDSLWEQKMNGNMGLNSTSDVDSLSSEPELTTIPVYISPVTLEDEERYAEGVLATIDDVPEHVVEQSIREFHHMAAEADIELWRKLHLGALDPHERIGLLESHLHAIQENAQMVVIEWKAAREAEKEKRLKAEQERRLAEAKRNARGMGRKWGAAVTTVPEKVPPHEPQTQKNQIKKGAMKQQKELMAEKLRAATPVMELPVEPEEELPAPVPTKNMQTRFLANMWGKGSENPAHRPDPRVKVVTDEPRKPAAELFTSPPVSAPAQSKKKSVSFSLDEPETTPVPKAVPKGTRWKVEVEEEPEEEGASIWGQTLGSGTTEPASAWSWAMGAISGERADGPAKPSTGSSPPSREPAWPIGEDLLGGRRGPHWPSEKPTSRPPPQPDPWSFEKLANAHSPPEDPRFATWRPPRPSQESERGGGPARKMVDLAMQNLGEMAGPEEEAEPTDIFNAMAMYTRAASGTNRKKGASTAMR